MTLIGARLVAVLLGGRLFNPISSPLELGASLKLWLRADVGTFQESTFATPAVADTDPVGGWQDQSGNGNDFIQATAGSRPLLKLGIVNEKSVLRFDGLASTLACAGLSQAQPDLVVIVGKQTSKTTAGRLIDATGAGRQLLGMSATTGTGQLNAAANMVGSVDLSGSFRVMAGLFNGTSSQIWQNGTSVAGPGAGGANTMSAPILGHDGVSVFLNGDIAEVLIVAAPTATQRLQLQAYLGIQYGLVIA